MVPVLECVNLNKSFAGLNAVYDFNLRIDKQICIGLVGPNGAGKTTLLSILCGFLKPTSGMARILGHAPESGAIKGRIGILPQDIPMLRGISVYEQLLLFARLQNFNRKSARTEVDRIIHLTHLSSLIKQFPETLSYGQRKKVSLAQALIGNPEMILLDEPTSGLDPVAANDVRTLIQKNRNNHSFVVSSHNLDEIRNVCDEIIIIDKGKLVRYCSISELIDQDNILTIQLNQVPENALLDSLNSLAAVNRINIDPNNPKRLSISFRDESPDKFQYEVLDNVRKHGIGIVEFSRGSAFADKVVELVKGK